MAQLDGLAEQRKRSLTAARTQVSLSSTRIVTAHDRGVRHFLEAVHPGFARLELDEVQQLHLLLKHEVVEPQEDPGPMRHRHPGPGTLRGSGGRESHLDVGRRRQGQ